MKSAIATTIQKAITIVQPGLARRRKNSARNGSERSCTRGTLLVGSWSGAPGPRSGDMAPFSIGICQISSTSCSTRGRRKRRKSACCRCRIVINARACAGAGCDDGSVAAWRATHRAGSADIESQSAEAPDRKPGDADTAAAYAAYGGGVGHRMTKAASIIGTRLRQFFL